ncbi:MAG: hypothetical protein HFJ06_08230 [Lachnospiraceae bacterium]|nr:hypothetical protein [Lachnospiraceae bacterium]
MRITTQILTNTSREAGIPLVQGGLLDALNKENTSVDLLEELNKSQDAKSASALQKVFRELRNASDDLRKRASELLETGENSLFGKAEETKDTEKILSGVKDMISSYNKTLELLKGADGSLNSFYYKELKSAAAANEEQLKSVGVTLNKDGSLSIDEKILGNADYDTLKKVFGDESKFVQRTEYISDKVSQNAKANEESIFNQYNAKGISYSDYSGENKYNFFG